MLIMNQNRTAIIDTTGVSIEIRQRTDPKIVAFYMSNEDNWIILGRYASVDRMIDILRNILQAHAEDFPSFFMPEK